jgi:hypothetical protein
MMKYACCVASLLAFCIGAPLMAVPIGRPVSLDIQVIQGSTTLISQTGVTINPLDPLDGKTYMNIGSLGGGLSTAYLSIYEPGPSDDSSMISFFIRAGLPQDANLPGDAPLLDLLGSGKVSVLITNLKFEVGGVPSPVSIQEFEAPDGDYSAAFYMMDSNGWFYELPLWKDFPPSGSFRWAEVPHSAFRDSDPSVYEYTGDVGTNLNISWTNVLSPVDTQYILRYPYTLQELADTSGGSVFEAGMAAYVWSYNIPEPATLAMVLVGIACLRRRA